MKIAGGGVYPLVNNPLGMENNPPQFHAKGFRVFQRRPGLRLMELIFQTILKQMSLYKNCYPVGVFHQ